jgi:hypothetical protein
MLFLEAEKLINNIIRTPDARATEISGTYGRSESTSMISK